MKPNELIIKLENQFVVDEDGNAFKFAALQHLGEDLFAIQVMDWSGDIEHLQAVGFNLMQGNTSYLSTLQIIDVKQFTRHLINNMVKLANKIKENDGEYKFNCKVSIERRAFMEYILKGDENE